MTYIDGFVLAVPAANREAFRAMAARVAKIFVDHGAIRVTESWGDDVPVGEVTDFHRAVQTQDGEVVVFSFVEWPSKEVRDAGNDAIVVDPRMERVPQEMNLMDPKRMIYGGFVPLVDERGV